MTHSERMLELLTEQGERALSKSEATELDALLDQNDGWQTDDFEFAAAAADLALSPPRAVMPVALKSQILSDALARATEMQHRSTSIDGPLGTPRPVLPGAPPVPAPAAPPPQAPDAPSATTGLAPLKPLAVKDATAANDDKPTKSILLFGAGLGWAVAAAALVFAIVGGQNDLQPPPPNSELRAALIAQSSAINVAWTQTKDPLGTKVTGDVVWSNERQEGYMRFAGLPKNDPSVNQYQLWIFDENQDARYPVDGGVFDIDSATGEVIVDIRAKIRVKKATLFAVTLEKPGGVVVSTRERLVTLAKPKA